jgi:hypothetical protein
MLPPPARSIACRYSGPWPRAKTFSSTCLTVILTPRVHSFDETFDDAKCHLSLRLERVVLALAAVTVVVVTVVVAALAFIGFLGGGIADLPELEALEDSEAADSEPSEASAVCRIVQENRGGFIRKILIRVWILLEK